MLQQTNRSAKPSLRGKNSLGSKSSLAAAYYSRRTEKKITSTPNKTAKEASYMLHWEGKCSTFSAKAGVSNLTPECAASVVNFGPNCAVPVGDVASVSLGRALEPGEQRVLSVWRVFKPDSRVGRAGLSLAYNHDPEVQSRAMATRSHGAVWGRVA
ncbi:hypothetical protein Bbelb_402320 [Branchiostoma belcheri]|nr:hypothetical protein Bbelb_402320 [Branchiostoma belcheri]